MPLLCPLACPFAWPLPFAIMAESLLPRLPQHWLASLLAVLTVRGRSSAGLCLKKPTGFRWKPTVSTGITAHSRQGLAPWMLGGKMMQKEKDGALLQNIRGVLVQPLCQQQHAILARWDCAPAGSLPGKSSGRTRWVAPNTCQTTGSEPAAMERPCMADARCKSVGHARGCQQKSDQVSAQTRC